MLSYTKPFHGKPFEHFVVEFRLELIEDRFGNGYQIPNVGPITIGKLG